MTKKLDKWIERMDRMFKDIREMGFDGYEEYLTKKKVCRPQTANKITD